MGQPAPDPKQPVDPDTPVQVPPEQEPEKILTETPPLPTGEPLQEGA